MVDLDDELMEMKRAVAHMDLGLKAYRAATRDQIDASRLLISVGDEVGRLIDVAEKAREKISNGLKSPASVEG